MGKAAGGMTFMKKRILFFDRLVVSGLHKNDFEWACEQYKIAGYALICFGLDFDGYHWKAIYVKNGTIEKLLGGEGVPSDRLCLCTSDARSQ
jgi:hypothetical protein